MGFFSDLETAPSPTRSSSKGFFSDLPEQPSRTRSLLSAAPKGLIRGVKSLESLKDPLSLFMGQNRLPNEEEVIEKVLPTQKGKFLEDLLETAGETAPAFVGGPGGLVSKGLQVGGSALAKSGLKFAEALELAQEIGGLVGGIGPQGIKGILSKKLVPSKAQQETYDLLKSYGFSDKTITPFIQSKRKTNLLAKWGSPFLNREKIGEELRTVGDEIFGTIAKKGETAAPLSGIRRIGFLKKFNDQLKDIPYFHRDLIEKNIGRLKNSNLGWKDLREFELAINNKIKGTEGGKAVLGRLKDSINLGERLISPDLFKEKQVINKIYSSGKNLLKKLPEEKSNKIVSNVYDLGALGAIAYSLAQGNPIVLKGYALKKGSELAAAKLLTSPRFQNIRQKTLHALSKGNKGAILKFTTEMLEKIDPLFSKQSETESEVHNSEEK